MGATCTPAPQRPCHTRSCDSPTCMTGFAFVRSIARMGRGGVNERFSTRLGGASIPPTGTRAATGRTLQRQAPAVSRPCAHADTSLPQVRRLPARVLAVLGTLAAFGPLSTDLYLPGLPGVAADLNASSMATQGTLTTSVIGLGLGQLFVGPLSDRFGRRTPLIAGLVTFVVFSIGCAVAPNVGVLLAMRFGQALGGAAGLVIARAMVRDLADGDRLIRAMAMLMLVSSLAPILAPLLGGQLISVTSWRGVFVALAVIGALLLAGTVAFTSETLPPERRSQSGVRRAFDSYAVLARDRHFVTTVATFVSTFGTLFAYIAASPFLLQVKYGLSAQMFSVVFSVNALLVMAGTRTRLRTPLGTMRLAIALQTLGIIAVGASVYAHLGALLVGFALICFGWGVMGPTAAALALADHRDRAGAAAALQGASQFAVAGLVGPLVGATGPDSVTAFVVVVAVLTIGAWVSVSFLRREKRRST